MNVFICFGYNPDDQWIKDLVFPLIKTFDVDILTGEDLWGRNIPLGVIERIKKSDAVLGFLTRRDALANGTYTSHQWVRDELTTSLNNNIRAVEIRERRVDPQGGIIEAMQRIEFDLDNKAGLLIEIAKCVADLKRSLKPRRLVLIPGDIVQDARPYINNNTIKCTYQFRDRNRESEVYSAKPFKSGQGLCVDVINVPSDDSMIKVTIKGPTFEWISDYESVELLSIKLEKSVI